MRGTTFVIFSLLFTLGCASQNQTATGIRYYGQAQYDAAMAAFQSSLKANPNDHRTLYNIAATHHQSGRALLRAGQVAAAQQQYEQAAHYYQSALTLNPQFSDAYRGLSALYMDCQNAQSAFELLIGWSNANPVAVEPKIELARLYQEYAQICAIQGHSEVAQNCRNATEILLQQVVAAEPANYRALRALGFLKEQNGDIAGAILEYQRSLQAYPQQTDIQERIAILAGQ